MTAPGIWLGVEKYPDAAGTQEHQVIVGIGFCRQGIA